MQLLRKIFFYIFTAIYVVLCPLLLLYAFGYIYKPGPGPAVVKTGLIYFATAPPGAAIYVNDVQQTEKTPTAIRDLLPGKYSVRLALSDYTAWKETVPVEAEKATVLDKILLIPDQWESDVLIPGKWQEIIPVPGTDFFLARGDPAAGSFFVLDYKTEKAHPFLSPESPYKECGVISYFTSEGSSAVLLRAACEKQEKFLWAQLDRNEGAVKDVTELFPQEPAKIMWPPDEEHFFVFQEGHINRVDVSTGAIYPEYIRNVRGFGLSDGWIYCLLDDGTFLRMDYDKKNKKVLLDDAALAESIFGKEGFFEVKVLSDDVTLFLGDKGQLLANHLPYRFIDKGVRGTELHPKLNRVLVWKKGRIGILDFQTEKTGNVNFEKGPTLTWVYTQGKDIKQAFLAYDASHVLFLDSSGVFLIEIEEYGEFKIEEVFQVKEKSTIFYSEVTGKMYFLDHTTSEIQSVIIVPKQGIMSQ